MTVQRIHVDEDEVTEDIFDMSNVRIFKDFEKKKMGMFILCCLRSAELSKAFGVRNICNSKISVVMLLGYMIAGISQKLEPERKNICPAPKCCIYK